MATKRTVDQGRHRRRGALPLWGHVIVAGLMVAGITSVALTGTAFAAVLAIIAALLAEETISDRRSNPPAVRVFYGLAAAVLALAAMVLTVDGLGGDPTVVLIIAGCAAAVALAAWRINRVTHQLDRIVEEVAPR